MAQSIQAYLHGLGNEHKRIATALLKLVQQAAPQASVAMKWDQIAFEQNGPFCFIKSTPSHVVFGFWRGQEIDSAKGKLEADTKAMAHLKLTAEGDIKKDIFQRWVKEAVKLNQFRPLTCLLILALLGAAPAVAAAPARVVFDTDSAYFADDGLALAMLLRRPDLYNVTAMTLVAGNYAPLQGVEFMTHVLDVMHRPDVAVYLGADRPLRNNAEMAARMKKDWGLGFMGALGRPAPVKGSLQPPSGGKFSEIRPKTEDAVSYLIESLDKSPSPTTVVALGPMTNLALALKKRPELALRIGRLVFMGGNVHVDGNVTKRAEFNFWFDPEAAKIVLAAPIAEKIMVPLDLTNQALLDKGLFDELVSTSAPLSDLLRDDLGAHFPRFLTNPKATRYVWDALVAGYMIDPGIATKSERDFLDVDVEFGPGYGGVAVRPGKPGETPVTVLTGLDFKRFFALLKRSLQEPIK